MTDGKNSGDPSRVDLQWFAEEGNPGGSQDAGQGGGSFLTGSNNAATKTEGQPAQSSAGAPAASEAAGSQGAGDAQNNPSRPGATNPTREAEGGAQPPAWKAQLPKDLQADARFDRFPSLGELGRAYVELEGKLGGSLSVPGEGASAEEWNGFYEKLGRPADPADYALVKEKNLPPGLEYGDDSGYRAKVHELGLSKKQAEGLFAWINGETLNKYKELGATQRRSATEAEATLKKEWGKDFDRNRELMSRAVTQFGDKETIDLFESRGLANDPRIARLFAKIGASIGEASFLQAEGGSTGGGSKMFEYPGLT